MHQSFLMTEKIAETNTCIQSFIYFTGRSHIHVQMRYGDIVSSNTFVRLSK